MCEDCARERAAREAAEAERDRAAQIANKEAVLASAALSCATYAESRLAAAEECLRPFVDPASYSTNEEECRLNPAMDWCAVHSFRWPCPVAPARAFLAGGKTK